MGKLNVTMHHNWWASGCDARMPRVRYGQVHVYNNYYDCQGNNYCIGVGNESHIRVESNYFNRAYDPWKDYYGGSGTPGEIGWNSDNIFYRCYLPIWAPNRYSTIFTPPYAYTLDDTEDIPAIVGSYAGAENPYPPHWLYTVYGDFDKDGVVESDDFETFIGYWMETFGIDEADYFDDDIIDAHEFALFAQNWLEP
jgi:hypothetical protein